MERVALKRHLSVDLVSDDGERVPACDVEQSLEVLAREHRSARVGWVVDHERLGPCVDESLKLLEVRLPPLLGQKIVLAHARALRLGEDLVEREARPRNQQVVALVEHPVDRDLERARAAARNDHVLRLVHACAGRETLGDGGARGIEAGRCAVTIELALADERDHRLVEHLGRLQVAERCRVTQRKGDDGLARNGIPLLRRDLLHNFSDRVGCALCLDGHGHVPDLGPLGLQRARSHHLRDVRLGAICGVGVPRRGRPSFRLRR